MLHDGSSPSSSSTARRRTFNRGLLLAGLFLVVGLVAMAAWLKPSPIDHEAPQPAVHAQGLAAAFLRSAAFGGEASPAVVQLGHRHEITDFRFLGEGHDLLTRARGEEIILWDALSGKRARPVYDIIDRNQSWTDYILSAEGRYLITRARGGEDVLWDVRAGRRVRTVFKRLDPQQPQPVIVISPDSRTMLLATADPEPRLELHSVESGELLRTFDLGEWTPVRSLRFSDDSLYVIGHQTISGPDRAVGFHVWDASTGRYVWQPGMPLPYDAALLESLRQEVAADGRKIQRSTAVSLIYLLFLRDVRPDGQILSFRGNVGFFGLSGAFCPAGKRFITRNWWNSGDRCDETVLWDVASATPLCVSSEDDFLRELEDIFAFSPDGQRFVNGILSRKANLIDTATGQTIRSFEGHEGRIVSLAFGPDETTILTGDDQGTAILWDVASGEPLRRFTGHARKIRDGYSRRSGIRGVGDLAFSPDGTRLLVAGEQGQTTVYAADTGEVLHVLKLPMLVPDSLQGIGQINVAWSPDGTRIVTAASSRARQGTAPRMVPHGTALWNAETGERLAWIAATPKRFILLGPGGRWAVGPLQKSRGNVMSGVWDSFRSPLPLWNTRTGELVHCFEEYYLCDPARDDGATQHPSTRTSAGVGEVSLLRPPLPARDELWLSPSGRKSLAAIADLDEESRAWLGRPDEEWKPPQRFPPTRPRVRSPSGRYEVRWNQQSSEVRVTDAAAEKTVAVFDAAPLVPSRATFNAEETRVLIAYSETELALWDIASGDMIDQFTLSLDHRAWPIIGLKLSPDERFVAIRFAREFRIHLLDLTNKEGYSLPGRMTSTPRIALFSPDSRQVICHLRRLTLWDIEKRIELADFGTDGIPRAMVFSPGGEVLLLAADGVSRLWDVKSGEVLKTFEKPVSLMRFNPAGTRMVSLSGPRQLVPIGGSFPPTHLWNFETGRPIHPLVVGSAGSVLDGFFSPDGERLITLHETAFAVWNAETGRQLHLHRDETYRFGARTSLPQPFFLADGRRLVTVHENAATIWDTETGTPLHRMDFASTSSPRILHDPDDDWLLTICAGHHATLWDLETGQRRQVFEGVLGDFSSVLGAAWFGDDGRELFVRHGLGHLVTVWDVATGAVTRRHYLLNEGRDWLTELPASGEFTGATRWVHWRE